MEGFARLFIVVGVVFVAIGLLLSFGPSIPGLGRLPGDIRIERPGGTFHFPIVSCLLVSVVVSLLLSLFTRMR